MGAEYRQAWFLRAASHVIEVQVAHPKSSLRLGVRPTRDGAPVRVLVTQNEKTLAHWDAEDSGAWFDDRVLLPDAGQPCRVYVSCDAPLWLSHCDVAAADYESPNVVIFLVDTLRADHLGCYGYAKNTSPNLDAFATDAFRFTDAIAQSSWTRTSVASLLTSMYPAAHGVQNRHEVLRDDLPSLATAFRRGGYATVGINTNDNLAMRWGFGGDFERYIDLTAEKMEPNDRDRRAVDRAKQLLPEFDGVPLFLYVHIMAPHWPYAAPEPFTTMFVEPSAADAQPALDGFGGMVKRFHEMYEGDIAFADALFGDFVEAMREQNVFDRTVVAVLSDHGEAFHEHGSAGHGQTLFDEETRIPLLLKPASRNIGSGTVEGIVELVDIGPTLLDLAGLSPESRFRGRSLLPLINGAEWDRRFAYSRLLLDLHDVVAVRTKSFKFIRDAQNDAPVWYALDADPGEQTPLQQPPEKADWLEEAARTRAAQDGAGVHVLLVDRKGSERAMRGTITVAGMERYHLHHPGEAMEARRDGDTVSFDGSLAMPSDMEGSLVHWFRVSRLTNFMKFRAEAPLSGSIAIDLDSDGPTTRAGARGKPLPLDGTPVPLVDLVAWPDRYSLSELTDEFALYAWYVAPPERIRDADLPPEVLEDLEALGYIN